MYRFSPSDRNTLDKMPRYPKPKTANRSRVRARPSPEGLGPEGLESVDMAVHRPSRQVRQAKSGAARQRPERIEYALPRRMRKVKAVMARTARVTLWIALFWLFADPNLFRVFYWHTPAWLLPYREWIHWTMQHEGEIRSALAVALILLTLKYVNGYKFWRKNLDELWDEETQVWWYCVNRWRMYFFDGLLNAHGGRYAGCLPTARERLTYLHKKHKTLKQRYPSTYRRLRIWKWLPCVPHWRRMFLSQFTKQAKTAVKMTATACIAIALFSAIVAFMLGMFTFAMLVMQAASTRRSSI